MLKNIIFILALSSFTALTGCASIVNGTSQKVTVHTGAVDGASCRLMNNKGQWTISKTPGMAIVHRSYQDLTIDCAKAGFGKVEKKVPSKTKAMAFGNILFGGGIGAGIDMANGSAYDYPSDIIVPMHKS